MSTVSPGSDVAPMSRADRKVQIQQNILDAAVLLTERHGPDGWTMQMLAAELGWSQGAAYRHLSGKDELLESVAIEVLKRVPIPEDKGVPWEERLRGLAWATWKHLSKQRWVAQYILTHPETGAVADRFLGAPLLAILTDAGYDTSNVSLPIGFYAAFMFGSLCGFEADNAGRTGPSSDAKRTRSRRIKGHSAEAHFEWGLTALIQAIRAQA
ncbi:MAG TPA: TetR/AcrR family transcriptional regulator [Acidimicrobiia bacterium]|nr:TetR/AcrR family transcriptional regulator [Acidimicrobiia bacterium]